MLLVPTVPLLTTGASPSTASEAGTMTEEEQKTLGPFSERRYAQGFNHAVEDIRDNGWEDSQLYASTVLNHQPTWYQIGYRTAVNAYKEGQAI
jgi:hypothetical protein